MSTVSSFKSMKKFCESLRDHAMKIINFKVKKIKLLTKDQQKSFENGNIYYICKEKFKNVYVKDKKYHKVRDHCQNTEEYRGAANSICVLKYSVSKNTPMEYLQITKNISYIL